MSESSKYSPRTTVPVTNIADARQRRTEGRDNLLVDTLDDAGVLGPLMSIMFQELEEEEVAERLPDKPAKPMSYVRRILKANNPDLTEDELDGFEGLF